MAKLRERIDALEAKAPAVQQEQDAALRAFRAKAEHRLLEKIEDARAGRDPYAELDAAGRVRHWQQRIAEARALIDGGGIQANDDILRRACGVAFGPMRKLDFKEAEEGLRGAFHYHLAAAQLDRLEELGFDSARLAGWRAILKKVQPWAWRPDMLGLPPDARKLLK